MKCLLNPSSVWGVNHKEFCELVKIPTSLSKCCILQKTSTQMDSSKESVSVTEIFLFTPLISLVCNLQIYTYFTSYDKKKNTQTKFYQLPTFLPNLLFFPETFFSSASSTIPYNGENNSVKKVPRMSFQLSHRMINFFSTVSSLTLSSSDWL